MTEPRRPAARVARRPVVGPRLRVLLAGVAAVLALLGANSAYLVGVRVLDAGFGVDLVNWFVPWMLLAHVALGVLVTAPLVAFGVLHWVAAKDRKNRRAIKVGYALFAAAVGLLVTGFLLCRIDGVLDLSHPTGRAVVYGLHVALPVACGWLYWLHRLAGKRINWKLGGWYAGGTAAVVGVMCLMHSLDPRTWNAVSPESGAAYFEPSLARTAGGTFIPAAQLMNDASCAECHPDSHAAHKVSAHSFSSFNNPLYLAAVRATRDKVNARDGSVQAARWCAGCHDPVPFFSGQFDDPNYDDVNDPTAGASITCTVCHGVTEIGAHGGVRGNADYVLSAPEPYPFEGSENAVLKWVNRQLVKAKPAVHKKDMLKPLHKSAEFCATCHKVGLPEELNDYKWLRGQNHYDSFLLSGVSGGGASSFYYPPVAEQDCNGCHMPRFASADFGATPGKVGDYGAILSVHDHTFRGANTAAAWLRGEGDALKVQEDFLKGCLRVDLFGVRADGRVDGELTAPLRPAVPELAPGETVLLETVVRTLTLGHHFTQGTADSNEVWVELTVSSGGEILLTSGSEDGENNVDPAAHFLNAFVVDRDGNRIARRNAEDIFTPLYNHQIPPGAASSLHYKLDVPEGLTAPLTVSAKVKYRKFSADYMRFVAGAARPGDHPLRVDITNPPVVVLAKDAVTFPIAGLPAEINAAVNNPAREIPEWQRWNDYGIGALLKGKAELRQAAAAFSEVEELGQYHGPLNLARVRHAEGRIAEAAADLARAGDYTDPAAPPWTVNWLSGVLNREAGRLEDAAENFRDVLRWDRPPTAEMRARGFDFGRDYRVADLLGQTLYDLARRQRGDARRPERERLLREAVAAFEGALDADIENVTALDGLARLHRELGDDAKAAEYRRLHAKHKPDDTAAGRALRLARERYPDAARSAEMVVIYELKPAETSADTSVAARVPRVRPDSPARE